MRNKVTTPSKRKINTILATVVGILSVINIIASATLSSSGEKLRELESKSLSLKHENQLLEQKIVTSRSLTKLATFSENLGFIERPQIVTLSEDEAVAQVLDLE